MMQPTKTAAPGASPNPVGDRRDANDGDRDLDTAAEQHGFPQTSQTFERKLETDSKQQQDDTDLGEHLDLVRVVDQAERSGPCQHAGQDEAGDGGDAETPQQRDDQHSGAENDDQVFEKVDLGHAGGMLPEDRKSFYCGPSM